MKDRAVPAAKARKRAVENRFSRWRGRSEDNRLEPECWPTLTPSFRIDPGAKIFTIGSCFARNIEAHLADLGYEMPVLDLGGDGQGEFQNNQFLNKYTPPAIFQELDWTRRIMKRDHVVRLEDVQPLLLERSRGEVYDLHLLLGEAETRRAAIDRRRAVFRIFREAFSADVVIITLGSIETWRDRENGLFLNGLPVNLHKEELARFEFVRLDFAVAAEQMRKALKLLLKGRKKKILLTTSPVPMTRTFTGEDVIVANSYSKSVMRAVAGQMAIEFDEVDYFPSYENVMLTRQPYVLEDDLQHVSYNFTGKVIASMLVAYTDSGETGAAPTEQAAGPDRRAIHDFCTLMQYGNSNQAREMLAGFGGDLLKVPDPLFHVHAARLYLLDGKQAQALSHGEEAIREISRYPREQAGAAGILYRLGAKERARSFLTRLMANCAALPGEAVTLMRLVENDLPANEIVALLTEHFDSYAPSIIAKFYLSSLMMELDRNDEAMILLEEVCDAGGMDEAAPFIRLGNLLAAANRSGEAIARLEEGHRRDPDNVTLRQRIAYLSIEAGDADTAMRHMRAVIAQLPDDASSRALFGRALKLAGRPKKALEQFEEARRLDPTLAHIDVAIRDLGGV